MRLVRLMSIVVLPLLSPTMCIAADGFLGIESLYRLDRMAEFRDSVKIGSVSSYDRTGGNNDGFGGQYSFVRKEEDGLVIADLKGPGVIYRIWTPTPTDDWMEFYFDGREKPEIRVRFRELFMGKHPSFPSPLVGYGAGGFYCYVPLEYERSCKILIRAQRVQFYQINYATYAEDVPISTFSSEPSSEYRQELSKSCQLWTRAGSDISSYAIPPGGEVQKFESNVTVEPGGKQDIFRIDKPGRIVGIVLSPADAFSGKDRSVTLKGWWDDDELPAIVSPVGDFFGYGWGKPAMKSMLLGTSGQKNYCYFPMPFDKSARLEVSAEPSTPQPITVRAEVLYVPQARRTNEGRFYAIWRRENPTTKGKPFTFIETNGRGHLVACIQQSQGTESGQTYFFEGDDQTTIDGELVIHGTGSEDFYNGGWYDVPGRWEAQRSFPLSGCLGYQKHLGRTGGYRILLGDAYAFRKSILQTIEHAPTGNETPNDYCGLTLLYSEKRPTCRFVLPDAEGRRVNDLDRIVFATWWNVPVHAFSFRDATLTKSGEKLDGKDIRYLSMRSKGDDWFGNHFICFTCELPAEGKYDIRLDVVKGPAQGRVQLFMNEAPVGPVLDNYADKRHFAEDQYLATLDMVEGANKLMFKLVGKNEKSTGSGLDLRNIICQRIK